MKLNNLKYFEKYGSPDDDFDDESYYNDDEYLFGRPSHSKKNLDDEFYDDKGYKKLQGRDDDYYDYEDEPDENDDMSHLLYLLRQIFKNSNIDVEVTSDDLDITVDAYLNRKERLKDVIKVFEVAKRMKRDILPQYDSEFQMYYSKTGQPILTFVFSYGDGEDDDNSPF